MSQQASYAVTTFCLIMAGILAALTSGGACGATGAGERGDACLVPLALASPIVEVHIYLAYITRFSPISPITESYVYLAYITRFSLISPLPQPSVYLPCILRFSSR